jgi:uncharacterized RDD family membrane protein YckC
MRPVIEFYGGTVIKSIGDAFLCTFPSATDAVICAIIIQLLLKEYNQKVKEDDKQLNLRVVINSGDVSIEENDIFGNAVNITARMESLKCFPGGSIGISESTHLLMDRTEITAKKIGAKKLKGVPEPVVVYKIPLEKQKLNKLPMQLLNLVEKVVNARSEPLPGSAQINEWAQSIGSFLKQANWGENIGKASKHIDSLQKNISKTFNKKTVIEQKKKYSDASTTQRVKSGLIDMVILVVLTIVLNIGWWPVQRIMFGSPYLSSEAQSKSQSDEDKNGNFARPQSIVEWVVDKNIKYPFILFWLYFSVFWKLKHASPGQIASGTAVISEKNPDNISIGLAMKRSALFLVSVFIVFGVLMIFIGEKKTFYDKLCETRVVA